MGGDGHGHHSEPYKVPDWRIYKVEDAPELLRLQRVLAAKGLKDPWIRNEVWRHDPRMWGTEKSRLRLLFFRGFKVGFTAFLITIAGTAIYDRIYPSEHNGHGHEGGHH